jgi:DNA (cytosine-5)-methyltransferase 1
VTTARADIEIVDLFCGCGGLTYGAIEGAARAGRVVRPVLTVDNDPSALRVLQATLDLAEGTVSDADLEILALSDTGSTANAKALFRNISEGGLLLAGPPCQGHSSLNNYTRHDDPRNDLYLAVARAASVIAPRALIVENVRSVARDRRGAMGECAAALGELGYAVIESSVDLHRIGVPQTRNRHVLIATRDERFEWNLPHVPDRSLRWAIEDLLPLEGTTPLDTPSGVTPENRRRIEWLFANDAHDLPNELRPVCHHGDHSYRSMYGRLRWDAPAQTVTSGFGSMGQGRYVHPLRPRTLTPH